MTRMLLSVRLPAASGCVSNPTAIFVADPIEAVASIAGKINLLADGKNLFGIFRLRRLERGLAGVDHREREAHPRFLVARAIAHHQ